jgi:hypothetical protein
MSVWAANSPAQTRNHDNATCTISITGTCQLTFTRTARGAPTGTRPGRSHRDRTGHCRS